MRCRISKSQVFSNRKIITVCLTTCYGMNKNTIHNMCSILSPGWSHQFLPASCSVHCPCTGRCLCTGFTNRNADCFDRDSHGAVCVNSQHSVHTITGQIIAAASELICSVVDSVSSAVKSVLHTIDPSGCILDIFTSLRIDITYIVSVVIYNNPASLNETTSAIQASVSSIVFYTGFICYSCQILEIEVIESSVCLDTFPAIFCKYTAFGSIIVSAIILNPFAFVYFTSI